MGSPGLNSHRSLVRCAAQLGSAVFSAAGRGGQTAIPRDPSSRYRFGESFFPVPQLETSELLGKMSYRVKKKIIIVRCDVLGVRTASRSSKMCRVGKGCSCAGWKIASRCPCLGASGAYGLKGAKRQVLPWLWESGGQEIEA